MCADTQLLILSPLGRSVEEMIRDFPLDAPALKMLFPLTGRTITRFAVSPDERFIVCSDDSDVETLEIRTMEVVSKFRVASVRNIHFSTDSALLSVYAEGRLSIWNVHNGKQLENPDIGPDIRSVALSPGHGTVAMGTGSGPIILRDSDTSSRNDATGLTDVGTEINALASSSDNTMIATASWRGELTIWSMESGIKTSQWLDLSGITTLAFTFDGKMLTSAYSDGRLALWNISDEPEKIGVIETGISQIQTVAVSNNGTYLAWRRDLHTVAVWDVSKASGSYVRDPFATMLAFSPDSDFLAIATRQSMYIHTLGRNQPSVIPIGQAFDSMCFSGDGHQLATEKGIYDRTTCENIETDLASAQAKTIALRDRLKVSADKQWITSDGKDILWIPPKRRPDKDGFWASYYDKIAIARAAEVHFMTM